MRYSSAGSLELLPPGFVVNDLGDDPALLAAFDLLMRVPKAAQDTESSAGRDRAVCLLLEALDRAYALKQSEAAVPARRPPSSPSKIRHYG